MDDRYQLVALGNEQLLAPLKGLVRRERQELRTSRETARGALPAAGCPRLDSPFAGCCSARSRHREQRFTSDAEFRGLLDEVRAQSVISNRGAELLPVMKRALEAYRRELQKKSFAVGCKPRSELNVVAKRVGQHGLHLTLGGKRTRRVAAAVRRAVYARDHGNCTFVSDDGRRCGARQFLELDHIQPWAQ